MKPKMLSEEELKDLLAYLLHEGSTGADLSPGDPWLMKAFQHISAQAAQIEALQGLVREMGACAYATAGGEFCNFCGQPADGGDGSFRVDLQHDPDCPVPLAEALGVRGE